MIDNIRKKVAYPALPYPNYGSFLQSLALFKLVKLLGYDCYIINYDRFINVDKPSNEEIKKINTYKNLDISSENPASHELKSIENKIIRYNFAKLSKNLFTYDNNIPSLSTGGEDDYFLVKDYDAFICGSDQVWSPFGDWFTPSNYLQFAPKGKRICYAASLGLNRITFQKQRNMPLWKHYLSEMTFLSGREERSSEILQQMSGKPVTTVLDPTLMFTAKEWLENIPSGTLPSKLQEYINNKTPYILAYLLHGYTKYKTAIEQYAQKHGYQIAWLTGTDTTLEKSQNRIETNPGGFLQLVHNASAVCTDSFHGTCFSIIFKKPFVSAIIGGMNRDAQVYDIRKYDLLDRLNISNRSVTEENLDILDIQIPYNDVNSILSEQYNKSLNYISNALKICTSYKINDKDHPVDLKLIPQKNPPRKINRVPLDDPLNCTGCGACRNICPVNAITMKPDDKGFINPIVDDTKCIRCEKCLKRCPLRNRPELFREQTPYAYAAWSLDPEIILNSSTGGIFSVLASWTFQHNGVVYGSAVNFDHSVTVHRATNNEELAPLRGSKYVQSDSGLAYRHVKEDLSKNRYVLFCGTSCQVAGLYAYLENDYNNLITIDLICGGLVSPLIYNKYIEMREQQAKPPLKNITFRGKKRGWGSLQFDMEFNNSKHYKSTFDYDPYGFMYLKKFTVRTSCHRCIFKGLNNRWSDFTIGDFWGIGKKIPFNHPRSQGVSAVCLNSIKARIIFQQLRDTPGIIFAEERSTQEMLDGNPILTTRPKKPVVYNKLFTSFAEKPFKDAFIEWFGNDDIRETQDIENMFKIK